MKPRFHTLFALLMVVMLAAAACTPLAMPQPGSAQEPEPTAAPTEPVPAGEEDIQTLALPSIRHLAGLLGLSEEQIRLVSSEYVEWPDGCLGVIRIDAICLAAVTPGYRLILEAEGQSYEYHTAMDGEVFVPAFDIPAEAEQAAVQAAVEALAEGLGIDPSEVVLVKAEKVDWPDGCLGLGLPGLMCTQAIVPGTLITLEVDGQRYEYRSNTDGSLVLPATVAFNWSRSGGIAGFEDQLVIFLPNTVMASSKTQQTEARLDVILKPEELEQFRAWIAQYGSSSWVETDAEAQADAMMVGTSLLGFGSDEPDDAAQQEITLFAQDLFNRMMQ